MSKNDTITVCFTALQRTTPALIPHTTSFCHSPSTGYLWARKEWGNWVKKGRWDGQDNERRVWDINKPYFVSVYFWLSYVERFNSWLCRDVCRVTYIPSGGGKQSGIQASGEIAEWQIARDLAVGTRRHPPLLSRFILWPFQIGQIVPNVD